MFEYFYSLTVTEETFIIVGKKRRNEIVKSGHELKFAFEFKVSRRTYGCGISLKTIRLPLRLKKKEISISIAIFFKDRALRRMKRL